MPKFTNNTRPADNIHDRRYYGYVEPTPYLLPYRRCLQNVLSQALTYMFKGEFHEYHFGIGKCGGGVNIVGENELVLKDNICYFDWKRHEDTTAEEERCSALVTHIVLGWNPMRPIESMLELAAEHAECDLAELTEACEKTFSNDRMGGGFDDPVDFFGGGQKAKELFDSEKVQKYDAWIRSTQ